MIKSLLVYDRHALLDLQHYVRDLRPLDNGEQKALPLFLSKVYWPIPYYSPTLPVEASPLLKCAITSYTFLSTKLLPQGPSAPSSDTSDSVTYPAVFDQYELVTLSLLEDMVSHIKSSGSPRNALSPQFFKEASRFLLLLIPACPPVLFLQILKMQWCNPCSKSLASITVLANFRPISQLTFISKLLEKIAYAILLWTFFSGWAWYPEGFSVWF